MSHQLIKCILLFLLGFSGGLIFALEVYETGHKRFARLEWYVVMGTLIAAATVIVRY